MRTHRLPLSICLATSCVVGCVGATNPLDPAAPPELQASGTLVGQVVLEGFDFDQRVIKLVALDDQRNATQIETLASTDVAPPGIDNAAGAFQALLPPGTYSLRFDASVNAVGTHADLELRGIVIQPGGSTDVDVAPALLAPEELEGSVRVSLAGAGLGSTVLLRLVPADGNPLTTKSLSTEGSGDVVIAQVADGDYRLVATGEGYVPVSSPEFSVAGAEAQAGTLTLTTLGNFFALVDDDDTAPFLARAQIQLQTAALVLPAGVSARACVVVGDDAPPAPALDDPCFAPIAADGIIEVDLAADDAADGPRTIAAQLLLDIARDDGAQVVPSLVTTLSVVLDQSAPVILDVTCLQCGGAVDGDLYTASLAPELFPSAADATSTVVAFTIDVDGGGASAPFPAGVPFAAPLLSIGPHEVAVVALDAAGNASAPATRAITVDATAPNVSADVVGGPFTNAETVAVALQDDEGSAPPVAMRAALGSTAGLPLVPFGPLVAVALTGVSEGPASLNVDVVDAAGSTTSIPLTITVDRTLPANLSVVLAGGAGVTSSSTATITIAAADAAPLRYALTLSGPAGDELRAGSLPDTPSPFALALDGTYTLSGSVQDAAGNRVDVTPRSLVRDANAPCAGGAELRVLDVVVDGGALFSPRSAVAVAIACDEGDASLLRIGCGVDAALAAAVPFSTAATCVLEEGASSITVDLLDGAGNVTRATALTPSLVFVDARAPSTPRFAPAAAPVVGTNELVLDPLVVVSTDAAGSGFSLTGPYRVSAPGFDDEQPWDGVSGLVVPLVEGDNVVRVKAVDRAGNASSEDFFVVRSDLDRPVISFLDAAAGNGEISIDYDSDDDDVLGFEVFYGPIATSNEAAFTGANADQGQSPVDFGNNRAARLTGLPRGTPVFVAVRAYDDVGPGPLLTFAAAVTPSELPLATIGNVSLPGFARAVAFADGFAFVVHGCRGTATCPEAGVSSVDISDPTQPRVISTCTGGGGAIGAVASDIEVMGDLAYVADGQNIDIVDISDPSALSCSSFSTAPDGVFAGVDVDFNVAIDITPGVLYVAAEREGLLLYSLANPVAPTFLGRHNPAGDGDPANLTDANRPYRERGRAVCVTAQGGFAYVCRGNAPPGDSRPIEIIDVHNPASPARAGTGAMRGFTSLDAEIFGDSLFWTEVNGGLLVHDLPGNGISADHSAADARAISSGSIADIAVDGGVLYARLENPLRLRAVSMAAADPATKAMDTLGEIPATDVVEVNVCQNSFIGDSNIAACAGSRLIGNPSRLAPAGIYLLEASPSLGLVVHRAARPVRANEVAHLQIPGFGGEGQVGGKGMALYGPNLVIARARSLGVIAVDDPARPSALGATPNLGIPSWTTLAGVVGDTFVVALQHDPVQDGIVLVRASTFATGVDVSVPGLTLERVDSVATDVGFGVGAALVRWPLVYVLEAPDGGGNSAQFGTVSKSPRLRIFDLRSHAAIRTVALPDGGETPSQGSMVFHRDRLYVTRAFSDIAIVDVSDPALAALVGVVAVGAQGASALATSGSLLFATGPNLEIFDLADPDAPRLIGSSTSAGFGSGVAVASDLLFSGSNPSTTIVDVSDATSPSFLSLPGTTRTTIGALASGKAVFVMDQGELSIVELE